MPGPLPLVPLPLLLVLIGASQGIKSERQDVPFPSAPASCRRLQPQLFLKLMVAMLAARPLCFWLQLEAERQQRLASRKGFFG